MSPVFMFVIGFVIMLIVAIMWPDGPDDGDDTSRGGRHRR